MPDRHLLTTLPRPLRSYAARITERADADAVAAGLTVEVLAGGVRRYRDPRLDRLPAHRASQLPVTPPAAAGTDWSQPRLVRGDRVVAVARRHVQRSARVCLDCAAVLHVDEVTGALGDQWGQAECGASCHAHAPDVAVLLAGPAAPANRIPDRRTEPGGPLRSGGAGAVPAPTVPRQGRSALAGSASLRDRLRRPLTRDTQQRRKLTPLSGRRNNSASPPKNPAPQHHTGHRLPTNQKGTVMSTTITTEGNLTTDPELRFTKTTGQAVCTIRLAVSSRRKNIDGEYEDTPAVFYEATAWGQLAEHLADTVHRGDRLLVHGSTHDEEWTDRDGGTRIKHVIQASAVGASLRYATATVHRAAKTNAQSQSEAEPVEGGA